jgi:SprT protein
MKKDLKEGLKPFLPENSLDPVMAWLGGRSVFVRITRDRRTKLGDYRPPVKDSVHRISVNGTLNPYEFLITLTHEIAHMAVWEKYGRRAQPHGKAWKAQFSQMLASLLEKGLFPPDMEALVHRQVTHPRANSHGHSDLVRLLHENSPEQPGKFLEDLPAGAVFILPGGRKFRKQEKLRKWYRCQSLDNKKIYRISPVARVTPFED